MENLIMTITEVAEYLKLSERTILRLVHQGAFPGTKVGGQWRFLRSIVDEWLLHSGNKYDTSEFSNSGHLLLCDLFDPDYILLDIKPGEKEAIFKQLLHPLVESSLIKTPRQMIQKLMYREQISSTGMGNGIAFPHIRNPKENPPQLPPITAGICREGTDFDSIDQIPVTLFFLLCSNDESTHLKIVSQLGFLLQKESIRKALSSVSSKEEFIKIIKENESAPGRMVR